MVFSSLCTYVLLGAYALLGVAAVAAVRLAAVVYRDEVREVSIEAAIALVGMRRTIEMLFSSIFTVYVDPFRISKKDIVLNGSKRRLGGYTSFALQCETEFERRVVSWFYRWFQEPTPGDWERCCACFGLNSLPDHILVLRGGEQAHIFVRIQRPAEQPHYVYKLVDITKISCCPVRTGIYEVGDLNPSMIVNREKWQEAVAKLS